MKAAKGDPIQRLLFCWSPVWIYPSLQKAEFGVVVRESVHTGSFKMLQSQPKVAQRHYSVKQGHLRSVYEGPRREALAPSLNSPLEFKYAGASLMDRVELVNL